ncbi:MAG: hypothetical protein H8E70_07305 [Candidatus Marinimicrobia bacterium]|nr:hypothetical protein [Candidatus Neomarinimicrobiota bacterium]
MCKIIIILVLVTGFVFPQSFGGDILNESPLTPIPEEMTFEEYQDMNRRLTIGIAVTALPIPGLIHDYAGEKKTAKRIRRVALGSIGLIIVGIAMAEEDKGEWEETIYNVYVVGEGDNEMRYEMIPTYMTDENVHYDLKPLKREGGGGTGGLIAVLGFGLLIADVIYDVYHGARIIEQKRDAVRFKYGKKLNFSYTPEMNLQNNFAGLKMSYNF